jgi:membrane protease subunit (stomatin/prohibitin family)
MGGDMAEMMKMRMGMNMAQNMMQNMQGAMNPAMQQQQMQPQMQQPVAPPAAEGPDAERAKVMETLKQLGDLKAAGILSEAEFETKKAELLARL